MSEKVGKVFDLTQNIEAMIKAGYHTALGMSEAKYRALWPKSVVQPPECAGRFDQVLPVEGIVPEQLIVLAKIVEYVRVGACANLAPAPRNKDRKLLMRYVAFFQDGTRDLDRSVENVRKTYAVDEVGLSASEGLHLPIQYEEVLRHHAVDLPGSRVGEFHAPFVRWFNDDRPCLGADDVRSRAPHCGSASRWSQVISDF